MGKASRLILNALADGETDPAQLAAFAAGRVHADREQLEAALTGNVDEHHRFLLREHLTQIDHFEKAIGVPVAGGQKTTFRIGFVLSAAILSCFQLLKADYQR